MTENFVNQITLDYLINSNQLKNHLEKIKTKSASRKDKKFYRKRIMNLTKDLLICKELEEPLLPDVKETFENFVKTCVEYFKTLDQCDIIQEDYNEMEEFDTIINDNKILSV